MSNLERHIISLVIAVWLSLPSISSADVRQVSSYEVITKQTDYFIDYDDGVRKSFSIIYRGVLSVSVVQRDSARSHTDANRCEWGISTKVLRQTWYVPSEGEPIQFEDDNGNKLLDAVLSTSFGGSNQSTTCGLSSEAIQDGEARGRALLVNEFEGIVADDQSGLKRDFLEKLNKVVGVIPSSTKRPAKCHNPKSC